MAPRLAVRATAGSKSFIFEAKLDRKTIRRTIGDTLAWGLDQARAEANRLQVLVESGSDPRELDRQKADARAAAIAAAEVAIQEAGRRAAPAIEAWGAYSAYLQVALLTGARREELAGLRWDDVDLPWTSLTIRDKVEGERTIRLTPYVAALLRDLKRRNDTPPPEWRILHGKRVRNDLDHWAPSPWVFSSRTAASGRLQEPRIAHQRALTAAGLPSITIHGLRRSFKVSGQPAASLLRSAP